jgi:hypothetical protein
MTRIACFAGVMIVLTLTAEGRAGGPPPVCMAVDKIVLEPNDEAPTRIQIWGTFILLDGSRTMYGAPQRGYLYYAAVPGKEEECRKEWANLRKLAAEDRIVAYGICGTPKVDGHLRKPAQKPQAPVVFPLCENGFTPAEQYVDYRSLKELLASPAPVIPADGERLMPGRMRLTARNIRDKEHTKARYVFAIESSAGEREESLPIAAGEKQTEWSPKMVVKAGEKYTWRVWATEGTWQGPSARSSFGGTARPR